MREISKTSVDMSVGNNLVRIPEATLESLKKEFGIEHSQIEAFISSLIDKAVSEHLAEANSNVLTEAETKELEEDLQGLGYI